MGVNSGEKGDGSGSLTRDNTPRTRCPPTRPPVLHRLGVMRRHPRRYLATVVAVAAALAGCSTGGVRSPAPPPRTRLPARNSRPRARRTKAPSGFRGRVTTTIDARGIHRGAVCAGLPGRQGVDGHPGGENPDLVEPFLKDLQGSAASGPATFNQTWAQLSTPQQAAVIIAVRAAASGGCS